MPAAKSHTGQLTPHFRLVEFNCHDGTPVPQSARPHLVHLCDVALEPLRAKFGPVRIHSGYRHRIYNARIGGARSSFHIYDLRHGQYPAADVEPARGSVRDWHAFVDRLQDGLKPPHGGLGYYPRGGFIHVDLRPYLARWDGS